MRMSICRLRSRRHRLNPPFARNSRSMGTLAGTLAGTTALVTGGSRGIGRAICLRLAAEGADIVLHYHRNRAAAEEVAAAVGREVTLVRADAGSAEEIEAMFRQLGHLRLDFLINNAGIWKH